MGGNKYPEPVVMTCESLKCGSLFNDGKTTHVPITLNGDLRWQCTNCGRIK